MVAPTRLHKFLLAAAAAWAVAGIARAGDFEDLVAAEKAFAADASARTTRDAFLAALADDGLVFSPGPTSGKRVWEARAPNEARLEWTPELAEVSASGDLGYTSGPWRFTPEGADKPTAFGHFLSVWRKDGEGHWRLLLDQGIGHAESPFPDQVIRRGAISAGTAPLWPVGAAELRKADLAPPGRLDGSMVSDDFLRLREGRLPDGKAEGEGWALSGHDRLDSGLVISAAGDLAVTWGGGDGNPSWFRVWRRPVAGDPPGLGWRLAVDMSLPVQAPAP